MLELHLVVFDGLNLISMILYNMSLSIYVILSFFCRLKMYKHKNEDFQISGSD